MFPHKKRAQIHLPTPSTVYARKNLKLGLVVLGVAFTVLVMEDRMSKQFPTD